MLILKDFRKNITVEHIGKAIGNLFLAFFCAMAWVSLGVVAFAILFQWILLLIVPLDLYPYTMNAFIVAWLVFGVWYAFVYLPNTEKKPDS